MSAPHLGYFAERPQPRLNVVRVLTDAEYERFRDATRLVTGFLHDYQQFEMVRASLGEYKGRVAHYSKKYRIRPQMNVVMGSEMNHAINRKLRGFFTEVRFFLDYAERKLKARYGKQSCEFGMFKRAQNVEFDGSFSYRFIYQLRNYAQHINLPINGMSMRAGEFNFFLGTSEHILAVEVDRDDLLDSSFHWRAADVRPQLEALSSRFELDSHIEEMMKCLERVHLAYVCATLTDVKAGAAYLLDLGKEVGNRGTPCVYHFDTADAVAVGEMTKWSAGIQWVSVDLADNWARLPETRILSQHQAFTLDTTASQL